jgi:hypothetical protein
LTAFLTQPGYSAPIETLTDVLESGLPWGMVSDWGMETKWTYHFRENPVFGFIVVGDFNNSALGGSFKEIELSRLS